MAGTHDLRVRLSSWRKQSNLTHPAQVPCSKNRFLTVDARCTIHLQNPGFCDAFAAMRVLAERKIADSLTEQSWVPK
jgi:hypothetical protein